MRAGERAGDNSIDDINERWKWEGREARGYNIYSRIGGMPLHKHFSTIQQQLQQQKTTKFNNNSTITKSTINNQTNIKTFHRAAPKISVIRPNVELTHIPGISILNFAHNLILMSFCVQVRALIFRGINE